MSDLPDTINRILVEALAQQDRFARNTEGVHMTAERARLLRLGHKLTEPDSRKVTLDIIEAFAAYMEEAFPRPDSFADPWMTADRVPQWLRSRAQETKL